MLVFQRVIGAKKVCVRAELLSYRAGAGRRCPTKELNRVGRAHKSLKNKELGAQEKYAYAYFLRGGVLRFKRRRLRLQKSEIV